jgi:type II secretory pathway pseudopilin PulG
LRHPAVKGFSLAEAVVGIMLMGILASAAASLMIGQMRVSRRSNERIVLESNHMLLQDVLRADIAVSTSSAITLHPDGRSMALQPAEELTLEGGLAHSLRRLILFRYNATEKLLVRDAWSADPPVTLESPPQRLSPAQWSSIGGLASPQRRFWTGLKSFALRSELPGQVTPRLWVDCEWLQGDRQWQVSYCLRTRQRP